MIDNMLYVSCYGHKAMFEDRVTSASLLTFSNLALKTAREKVDEFFESWKDYRRRIPIYKPDENDEDDLADLVNATMGADEGGDPRQTGPRAGCTVGSWSRNCANRLR